MSTFLQLCQDFQRETGITGAISSVTSQSGESLKIVNRIAQADVEIQNLWQDWRFLSSENNTPYSQVLTIGEDNYTKPSDLGVWDPDSFFLDYTTDSYQQLTIMDYREWRTSYRNGTQTNDKSSRVVIDQNDDLILWPPPDSAYTLTGEYWVRPEKMTANTDVSKIPAQFHRIIVLRAKVMYAGDDEAPAIFASAYEEYDSMLVELEAHQLPDNGARKRASGNNIVVRPV